MCNRIERYKAQHIHTNMLMLKYLYGYKEETFKEDYTKS